VIVNNVIEDGGILVCYVVFAVVFVAWQSTTSTLQISTRKSTENVLI